MPDPDPIDDTPLEAPVGDDVAEAEAEPTTTGGDERPDGAEADGAPFDAERGVPVELASMYDEEVLAALEGWEPPEHVRNPPMPSRLASWTRTSALGAAMAGLSIALRDIYENQKVHDAIVIEVDADGEPHDLPIRLLLDPDDPSGSLCIVRRDPPPPVV